MFDLVVNGHRRPGTQDAATIMMSIGLHLVLAVSPIAIPLLFASASMPQVPATMMAFVAAAPPPPAPPPPPPAPAPPSVSSPAPTPAVDGNPAAAPVEAPEGFTPEPPDAAVNREDFTEGVVGGIAGGIASLEASPPPPPPPSPAPAPVRIGGAIKQPPLLSRAEPVYPEIAVRSRVEGTVILEVVVDGEGSVEDVRILRSIPLLDRAAIDAVRQWRYGSLVVNGQSLHFVVTVTVTFQLTRG